MKGVEKLSDFEDSGFIDLVPSGYRTLCQKMRQYAFPEKYFVDLEDLVNVTARKEGNICLVGSGRMDKMAEKMAMFFSANDFQRVYNSSEYTDYPREYKQKDLIICFSGSGETEGSIKTVYPQIEKVDGKLVLPEKLEDGPKIVVITAKEESTLANLSRLSGGFSIMMETQHKDSVRNSITSPLEVEGTESEYVADKFTNQFFGYLHGKSPKETDKQMFDALEAQKPTPSSFYEAYLLLPKPLLKTKPNNLNGTIFYGRGLSGTVADLAEIRYKHLAPEGSKRLVYTVTDNTSQGDLFIVYSGSGEDMPLENAMKAKDKGARILAYAPKDSRLSNIADVTLEIPKRLKPKPANAGLNNLKDSSEILSESVSMYYSDLLAWLVISKDRLTEKDLKSNHAPFT